MQKYIAETLIRLDIFLSQENCLAIVRNHVQKVILDGNVYVNSKQILKPSYKLKPLDIVEVSDFKENKNFIVEPMNIKLDIIYEDDYMLVVNKKKGMLTHPTSYSRSDTLVNALLFHCNKLSDIGLPLRPGIVHRLDRDTAGLMMVAKTNEAHENLALQIHNKTVQRKYLSFVCGTIDEDNGTIDKSLVHYMGKTVKMNVVDDELCGKKAVTHYRVLKRYNNATFVELTLETGRTHQIRVHMASISHPVVNDELYGAKGYSFGRLRNIKTDGHVLMSYYLSFTHPITGEILEFKLDDTKYDKDFKRVLNFLEQDKA